MRSPNALLTGFVLLLIVISVPALASAQTAQVSVDGIPCTSVSISSPFIVTNGTTVTISGPGGTLPATCGDVTLDTNGPPGSFPQIDALISGSTDQLILSNLVVTNNSLTTAHTIQVTYSNFFSGVDETVTRFYGMSASGSFFRPPFVLASADNLTMTSSVTYSQNMKLVTVPIGTTCCTTGTPLTYTVPSSGSVSLNDFTPQMPKQIIEAINCTANLTGPPCDPGETITTASSMVVQPLDTLTLTGSTHNAACDNASFCAALLSALQARIDVTTGNANDTVVPGKSGTVHVDFFGEPSTELCSAVVGKNTKTTTTCVTVPAINVNDVNLATVVFGPACPIGYPTGAGCSATVQHASFLSATDLRLEFSNPSIGWNTNCQPLQRTGTLVGFFNDGRLFIGTGSVDCSR